MRTGSNCSPLDPPVLLPPTAFLARLCALLLIVAVALPTVVQAQPTITTSLGGCTIDAPEEFRSINDRQSVIETATEPVIMRMKLLQNADGSDAIMIAYCDYSEDILSGFEEDSNRVLEAMFDSARAGGLRNVAKSKLLSEKKMTLNGLPGRSIRFQGRSEATSTERGIMIYARFDYYMAAPRLYQIGYITSRRANLERKGIQAMFAGASITPPAAASESEP